MTEVQRLVLVCGGRDYFDRRVVFRTLAKLHADTPFLALCHGGAPGADRLAGDWAQSKGIPVTVIKAQWAIYRASAGPIRNEQLIQLHPSLVVAFPGGTGTQDMVMRAVARHVPVLRIMPQSLKE